MDQFEEDFATFRASTGVFCKLTISEFTVAYCVMAELSFVSFSKFFQVLAIKLYISNEITLLDLNNKTIALT